MNPVDFGKLIASLRKEHEDEEGNPWRQEALAQEANLAASVDLFSEDIIGRIERGKRSLDQQTLLALASALQLTSGERKEFFLAASGVDNERIARQENEPQEVLSQLIDRMKRTYLPAYIIDPYFDIVAVNSAVVELLDLTPDALDIGPAEGEPFPINALRFAFSDEAVQYLTERVGEDWGAHAFQTIMLFRTVSLRYRSTDYFQRLLRELKRFRLFHRYWREVYFEEKDQFVDNRHIRFNSTHWGPLVSYVSSLTALTTAGELHLCVHVPTTYETANAFAQVIREAPTPSTFRQDGWPDKDSSTANRLRPVY